VSCPGHAPADHRSADLAGKNKSVGNRERFLRRYKEQVKRSGAPCGRRARHPRHRARRGHPHPEADISEPVFHHGQGGVREVVHPGNREYIRGRPHRAAQGGQGGGSGKGQASDSGEGEDDFVFT
jgi:uncharacterized sporulation protein YeaH/YhbH (DUF444 family)